MACSCSRSSAHVGLLGGPSAPAFSFSQCLPWMSFAVRSGPAVVNCPTGDAQGVVMTQVDRKCCLGCAACAGCGASTGSQAHRQSREYMPSVRHLTTVLPGLWLSSGGSGLHEGLILLMFTFGSFLRVVGVLPCQMLLKRSAKQRPTAAEATMVVCLSQ